ncbi:MAG: tetratricopeptide repeat protein [Phycisphaerae bacterium]|nr:tetratricopeptide repeat protein [Phycisphaerae bacterium]
MAKKYSFNWKLALVFVVAVLILAFTAVKLRSWQRNRMALRAYQVGLVAYEQGQWMEAARNLGQYVAVNLQDVEALLKYADSQLNIRPLKQDSVKQAIASYRSILRIDRRNEEAAMKLIDLYLQMNIASEGQFIAERFLEQKNSPSIRKLLASCFIQRNEPKKAFEHLNKVAADDFTDIAAFENLGKIIERNQEDFLVPKSYWFEQAVEKNPANAMAYVVRASFYLRNGQKDKAAEDLMKSEQLDISDPAVRLRLAVEFANAQDFEKAYYHINEARKNDPQNLSVWLTWADIAMHQGTKEQMAGIAKNGLQTLKQNLDFMPVAAELLIRADELEQAEQCIVTLKKYQIDPPYTLYLDGLLADKQQDDNKAIQAFRQAIGMGDDSQRTKLALAVVLDRSGDYVSAIKQLRTLVAENPRFFAGHFELARIFLKLQDFHEAEKSALFAIELRPDDISAEMIYLQAKIGLMDGSNEKDISQLEALLSEFEEKTGGSAEAKLLRFRFSIRCGKFENAQQDIEQIPAQDKDNFQVAMAKVDLLRAQDENEKAIEMLIEIISKYPQETIPAVTLADLFVQENDYQKAFSVLNEVMDRTENLSARRQLALFIAQMHYKVGQTEQSLEFLKTVDTKLQDQIPIKMAMIQYAQKLNRLAFCQQVIDQVRILEGDSGKQWKYAQANLWLIGDDFSGHYPQIVEILKENLAANPEDQLSRVLLASAYEKAGQKHLAVNTYKQALQIWPENIKILSMTVSAMYKIKQYNQADELLDSFIDQPNLNPEFAKVRLQSYLRRGRIKQAHTILEQLVAQDQNDTTLQLAIALLKMTEQDYDGAAEMLNKLCENSPNFLPVFTAIIELNIRRKNYDKALEVCDKMVADFNNASPYIVRGKVYAMLGRDSDAKTDFIRASQIEPSNIEVWILKSDFYRSIGDMENAASDIEKALTIDPSDALICKRAISLFLASDDSDRTRRGKVLLDRVLEANPDDVELQIYHAALLINNQSINDRQQASLILQKITEQHPQYPQGWVLLSRIYLERKEKGKAMEAVLAGFEYSPNDKMLLAAKAHIEAQGSPQIAIPTLKMLNELYPDDAAIGLSLADIYTAEGNFALAIDTLNELNAHCSQLQKAKVDASLAAALYRSGKKQQAQQQFQTLYKGSVDLGQVFLTEMDLFIEEGDYGKVDGLIQQRLKTIPMQKSTLVTAAQKLAVTGDPNARKISESLLRLVLDQQPDNIQALSSLAILLQMQGKNTESENLYKRVLQLENDNLVAINNLAWLLCEQDGKTHDALRLARRGLEISPDYADLIDTCGIIYYKLGEHGKAVECFTRCLELFPKGSAPAALSHFHFAQASASLGDTTAAAKNLLIALQISTTAGGLSDSQTQQAENLLAKLSKEDSHGKITR